MEFAPTAEQQSALNLFATGKSLVIEAGAGTGKTSTLKLLAKSTDRRGQYIAFNKAIVEEAKLTMPKTVACNTAHSLAFREVGRLYAARLKNSQRMKGWDMAKLLGVDPFQVETFAGERKLLSSAMLAAVVMRSITRFCQSADQEPSRKHMPMIEGLDDPRLPRSHAPVNREVAKWIEGAMVKAWQDLTRTDGSLPFQHDHYLKMWHLSGPRIAADYILFDEAQDANPVLVDIVRQQEHAQLVWVGDSQQQIYTFTGAINALANVPADHRTFLTQSFRFGPAVAEKANGVLGLLNAELRLTGLSSIASVVAPVSEPDVLLTRTNSAAIRALIEGIQTGRKVHVVGGGAQISSFARAAGRLQRGERTDHPELACFESWSEVCEYVAQDEQGDELRLLVGLVNQFGVGRILEAIDKMVPENRADLIVSTAHKSKGREWNSVQLGNDFPTDPTGEELRLLYVAITRAKRFLDISRIDLFNRPEEEEAE